MKTIHLLLPLALVAALAACQKPDEPTQPAASAASSVAPPAAEPAAVEVAPTPVTVAPVAEIGIAECDDYLSKYSACMADKVPESARMSLQQSLDATRAAWKAGLGAPGAEAQLRAACTQARDAMRSTLQAYGCTTF